MLAPSAPLALLAAALMGTASVVEQGPAASLPATSVVVFDLVDLTNAQLAELPQRAHVELRDSDTPHGPARGVPCLRGGRTLRCEVPAGDLDLKLQVGAFAPIFRWGVRAVGGEETRLGSVRLVEGATITGRIELEGPRPFPGAVEQASVTLAPVALGPVPRRYDEAKGTLREQRVTPDERGFFSFSGVAVGEYALASELGDWRSPATRVLVRRGEVHVLAESLVVHPPLAMSVVVDPLATPQGKPWVVEVVRQDERSELFGVAAAGPTDVDGRWRVTGLRPGEVDVRLGDEEGSRWLEEHVTLDRDHELHLALPLVQIEGRLTFGGEPLRGVLWFGGYHSPERIRLSADRDGRFEGFLPRAGEWKLDLEILRGVQAYPPVEVAARNRRARLDIDLPRTVLEGKTVDEGGGAVPAAEVIVLTISDETRRREVQATTERDGRLAHAMLHQNGAAVSLAQLLRSGAAVFSADERGVVVPAMSPGDLVYCVTPDLCARGRREAHAKLELVAGPPDSR